jgi:hypothetical protein
MTSGRLYYEVNIEVGFTDEEILYLINRAKNHYDSTCQEAGTSMEDGGRKNGFIAQLHMTRPSAWTWVWTSRQLNLTLKILEPITHVDMEDKLRAKLFADVNSAFNKIQDRHKELLEIV